MFGIKIEIIAEKWVLPGLLMGIAAVLGVSALRERMRLIQPPRQER